MSTSLDLVQRAVAGTIAKLESRLRASLKSNVDEAERNNFLPATNIPV